MIINSWLPVNCTINTNKLIVHPQQTDVLVTEAANVTNFSFNALLTYSSPVSYTGTCSILLMTGSKWSWLETVTDSNRLITSGNDNSGIVKKNWIIPNSTKLAFLNDKCNCCVCSLVCKNKVSNFSLVKSFNFCIAYWHHTAQDMHL